MPIPFRAAILDALAVLFPVDCAGCGKPDRSVCDDCQGELAATITRSTLADGTVLFSALHYEGVARRVILALKEQGRTDVAPFLARPLAAVLADAAREGHVLATVPPSRAGFRRRGYDPVVLLLRKAGYRPTRALTAARVTRQQKLLDATERAHNRIDSLVANRSLAGVPLVLVDDVVTTGATILEAARAARAAGGTVVVAVALATTPKLLRP
jgi:ComF family protein